MFAESSLSHSNPILQALQQHERDRYLQEHRDRYGGEGGRTFKTVTLAVLRAAVLDLQEALEALRRVWDWWWVAAGAVEGGSGIALLLRWADRSPPSDRFDAQEEAEDSTAANLRPSPSRTSAAFSTTASHYEAMLERALSEVYTSERALLSAIVQCDRTWVEYHLSQ